MKKRLWMAALATVVFGLVLVLSIRFTHRDGGESVATQEARWFANQVQETLARAGLETRGFVVSEAAMSGDPARLMPYLNSLAATYGHHYGAMLVLNRRGKVIAANTVDEAGTALGNDAIFSRDLSSTSWFGKAVAELAACTHHCASIGDVSDADDIGPLFHQTGRFLTVAAPVRHPRTGEMLGLWVNRIAWDRLTEVWQASLGQEVQIVLNDGAGHGLFATDGKALTGWETTRPATGTAVRRDGNWIALATVGTGEHAWTVVTRAPASSIGGLWQGGALLVFLFCLVWAGRSMRRSMKDFDRIFFAINDQADHLKSAASQLTSCSQDLAQSATEQASSLQQTASSIDEINSMVNQSAENAERSAKIAHDSQETATRGREVVNEMIRAIGEISTSNGSILKQVEAGNQQLTDITKVIAEIGNKTKIINDIAFQTKLLSFNASVEAARAGEHGKGFAVVAEEVGSLANMSANAAKEINDMLAGSIQTVNGIVNSSRGQVEGLIAEGKSKIEGGIAVARQCEAVLEEIVKAESQMNSIINSIAGATREQAQGIGEITKAIGMLDSTTNRNASIAQQTEEFAEAIADLANALKLEVVGFRERLSGKGKDGAHHVVAEVPESDGSATFLGTASGSLFDEPSAQAPAEVFGGEIANEIALAADVSHSGGSGRGDEMDLASIFGAESEQPTPQASEFPSENAPAPAPKAAAGKVIPLRPNRAESPMRGASMDSLEETPSESDPRFKEV